MKIRVFIAAALAAALPSLASAQSVPAPWQPHVNQPNGLAGTDGSGKVSAPIPQAAITNALGYTPVSPAQSIANPWAGSGFGFTSAPTPAQVAAGLGGTMAGTGLSNSSGTLSVQYGTGAGQAVQGNGPSDNTTTLGRQLSARAQDVVNVKDAPYNAKGDTQKVTSTASMTAGSKILTLSGGNFTVSDVGKSIAVPNAGVTPATGFVSAIAVTSPGSGYTAAPTVTFSGSYTNVATPGVLMGVVSATLSSGGTCSGLAATVTGTLAATGTPPISPATFTLATNGTAITGVSTILTPGNWFSAFPGSLTSVPVRVTGCSGTPTLNISMGVVAIGFGNLYYGTGYGSGYPLTGVTATPSGGTPATAAVLGAVTVTPQIPPLKTTIASVQSATQVTLAAPAQSTVSQAETVTYGTDDTTAIQAALNAGPPDIYFPQSSGGYWSGEVFVPSNRHLYGRGTIMVDPLTTNPLFRLADSSSNPSSSIEVNGLTLTGNADSSININSGASLISGVVGNAHIYLHDLIVGGALPTDIALDGATDLRITNNMINGSYYGAGIQGASTTPSVGAIISGNYITGTQIGPISNFVGLTEARITDNYLLGSNLGYGDSSPTGRIQDCITGYSDNASNQRTIISGNQVLECGNNGIHWGGDHIIIANNEIYEPVLYGILVSRSPNSDPTLESDITIVGNHFLGADNLHTNQGAISVRNAIGCVISGNVIDTDYIGIEVYATADSSGGRDCNVSGNQISTTQYGIWLRKKAQYNHVADNQIYNSGIGIAASMNSLSIDTTGSFPSQSNFIGMNTFDTVTTPIEETQTANNNTFAAQAIVNGSWSVPPMTGAGSRWAPPIGRGDVATGLTATGSTQATAYPIAFRESVFSSVSSGTGAIVDGHMSGDGTVVNGGSNSLALYPPSGGTWNGGAANAAVSIPAGGTLSWFCASPSACFSH